MGRQADLDDLVGVAEIAERLGVGTSVVNDWRYRHEDFPLPARVLGMGNLWLWPDVEVWAVTTGRLAMPSAPE